MIALIVAFDKKRAIGKGGRIPWSIPGEQERFRALTVNNIVIMGRLTYEEIGKPLPNRNNIVISKTKRFFVEGLRCAESLEDALLMALAEKGDIFIAGGAEIYREALPLCEKLYITEIEGDFGGDRFFPTFDEGLYEKELVAKFEGDIPYSYLTYTRKTY